MINRFQSRDGSLSVSERLERIEDAIENLTHSVDELKTHAIGTKVVLQTIGWTVGIIGGLATAAYSIVSVLQLLHVHIK